MISGQSSKWLDAQTDGTAALHTLPSCLSLCDLKNDNYYKLIAAEIPTELNTNSKLKVYKGTLLVSEQGIPGIPSAVESLYIDENEPRNPIVAIAIGPSVLFYRNMKPYYKYTLPGMDIEALEYEMWRKLPVERPDNIPQLIETLKTLEMNKLTQVSQKLIHMNEEKRQSFIMENRNVALHRTSTITALTTLKKSSHDAKSVSCLIIATESGDVLILDSQTFLILHSARVCAHPATPSMISATGLFEIDFRIVVATREGFVCLLRKSWLEGKQIFKIGQPATGISLLPIDQTIVVVCMNKELMCFSKKGKRLWTNNLPYPIMCMEPVVLPHLGITLICVGLKGGLVQMYNQRVMVDQFSAPETVSAMKFGRLGQEDYVLVLVTSDGSLIVKILKRTAVFPTNSLIGEQKSISDNESSAGSTLQIPKKTNVFVEQTVREKENAQAIYQAFNTDLQRLRLTAARATVDVINSADSTMSDDIGMAPIKIAAEVVGLGPIFRLILTLENMAARKTAPNLNILVHADSRHYNIDRYFVKLPPLVPAVPIKVDCKVRVMMDTNDGLPAADLTPENSIIRIIIFKTGQAKPIIAATITMPTPEPLLGDVY